MPTGRTEPQLNQLIALQLEVTRMNPTAKLATYETVDGAEVELPALRVLHFRCTIADERGDSWSRHEFTEGVQRFLATPAHRARHFCCTTLRFRTWTSHVAAPSKPKLLDLTITVSRMNGAGWGFRGCSMEKRSTTQSPGKGWSCRRQGLSAGTRPIEERLATADGAPRPRPTSHVTDIDP